MRIATCAEDLSKFRDETRRASAFALKLIPLEDQDEWSIREGALSHRTRGFFHVAGAMNDTTGEERLVLHQPQAAITCLAVRVEQGRVHVLVQARPEPGNCKEVQYGPTIQSTPANFMGLHGGKAVPHLDCFIDCVPQKARPLAQSSQLDLGNRYFQKIKTLMYVEVSEWLETGHDLIWAPLDQLANHLTHDHFLNIDFRAMLACFDWDAWLAGRLPRAAGTPAKPGGRPVPEPAVPSERNRGWRFTGLEELSKWSITPHGVESRHGDGVSVRMYHAVCYGREKAEWHQPLFEASGIGEVTLYTRIKADGNREFLLSQIADVGLAGQLGWTTSIDRVPEEMAAAIDPASAKGTRTTLRKMMLSEEGGRFLRNVSRYEVVEVGSDLRAATHQYWVDLDTLKSLLRSSNMATIHLRCAVSLILDVLYPRAFAG